jgi:hypothetical protein
LQPLTLGIIGSGEPQSEIIIERLLEDQAKSAGGEVYLALPTNQSGPVQRAAAWFQQYSEPLGKSYDTVMELVEDMSFVGGRLLVFWDNDDQETIEAVSRALDLGIEVRDLNEALSKIGRVATNKEKEMPTTKRKTYTLADLEALSEPETEALAESYGIDHKAFEDWPPVIALIMEAQSSAGGAGHTINPTEPQGGYADEPLDAAAEDGGEPPTDEEIESWDLPTLKEFVKVNEIAGPWDEPNTRTRPSKYVALIKEWLAEAPAPEDEEPLPAEEPEEEGTVLSVHYPPEEEVAYTGLGEEDIAIINDIVRTELQGAVAALTENGFNVVMKALAAMQEQIDTLSFPAAPALAAVPAAASSPQPTRPVNPVAAAAANGAGRRVVRRVTREQATAR